MQAAAAVTLPLAVAAVAGDVQAGAVATLGALAVLYVHGLPRRRRAVRVAGVGAGLVLAVAVGSLGSATGATSVLAIAAVAATGALWSRLRAVPPPGAFMPVLACATATQIPLAAVPLADRLGLVALGAAGAWCVAMAGGLVRRRERGMDAAAPGPGGAGARLPIALRAAGRVGAGTATAAVLALAIGLPRPDWAAAACAAVLVHDQARATLCRAGHRALGTSAGIGLAGVVLVAEPGLLAAVACVAVLQLVVELVAVRTYAVAVAFITPLALLQGELATGGTGASLGTLLTARLLETALGCAVAVAAHVLLPAPGERPSLPRFRPDRADATPIPEPAAA